MAVEEIGGCGCGWGVAGCGCHVDSVSCWVSGGVSDIGGSGCNVCGGEGKDDNGAVVNGDDGESDPWHANVDFDFTSICIKSFVACDIFEAKLAFPNSTRRKWSLQYKDLSKYRFF